MKQERRERERRMKQRLREEAEQNRISGQSSIRTKQGQAMRNSSSYRFDEPSSRRRRNIDFEDDEPNYENNVRTKRQGSRNNSYYDDYDNSLRMKKQSSRANSYYDDYDNSLRTNKQSSRSTSYYDDYDNVEIYEEHKRKFTVAKKLKKTRSRYAGYSQEEIEMIKRQEKRKRLAEQRRREMENED